MSDGVCDSLVSSTDFPSTHHLDSSELPTTQELNRGSQLLDLFSQAAEDFVAMRSSGTTRGVPSGMSALNRKYRSRGRTRGLIQIGPRPPPDATLKEILGNRNWPIIASRFFITTSEDTVACTLRLAVEASRACSSKLLHAEVTALTSI